jgi:hypothetical protein
LYLVGSVYTDAYYGRLSMEATSLDLAPTYVGLQSIHAVWALLEYPLILLLLYVLYRIVTWFVPRSARWVDEARQRFPRLLAILVNIAIVVPLLVDDFRASFWERELPHRSVLTEVTSLLQTAGLILVAYAVWLAWRRRFLLTEIRAHRIVPIALVFTVYLLGALASTAAIAELAAEDLLTGASDAALRVEFLREPGVLPELDGKDLILVTARNSVYYAVERESVPPSEQPTSFVVPYSAVEGAEVSRFP